MPATDTFNSGIDEIRDGVRQVEAAAGEELAEMLRQAAEAVDSQDHDSKVAVMQQLHDHPAASDAERAEAAHHLAKAHEGRGDQESAAAWHDYTRQLPAATNEHHEAHQTHSQKHGAESKTHTNPLHDQSSAEHLQSHLEAAEQHHQGGNHAASMEGHMAIANHPNATPQQQAHAISRVAHAHAAGGDHESAAQWHRAAAEHPGAEDHHRQASDEHHRTQGAGSRVHGESSQDDLRRHVQAAEQQMEAGDLAQALEMLLQIMSHSNADGDTQAHAAHLTGRAHEANGNHEAAAEHHRRAAEHSSARSEHRDHHERHRSEQPDHHRN